VRTLSSLMRTRENFPVGHPSQIAPSHAHLTWRFFRDRLLKKKMHLIGMDTLLIILSLGLGYHHPRGQDITSTSMRKSAKVLGRRGQYRNPSSEKPSQHDRPENLPIPAATHSPVAPFGKGFSYTSFPN
jgi:hypothetical protein